MRSVRRSHICEKLRLERGPKAIAGWLPNLGQMNTKIILGVETVLYWRTSGTSSLRLLICVCCEGRKR